ncbi:MAG: molecular chaperone GrpE [Chloroflexi bacterium]|jgi:molecular chaperone GrpE|nr:MAG: molecular chaperone GrpE [Chloroflexota bacterium]
MYQENEEPEEQPLNEELEQEAPTDLPAQLEEALREKEQFRNMALRGQADLANYKRRVEEEREDLQQRLKSQMVLKLLDVADDFERALAHVPPEDTQESWVQGITLIGQKVWSMLEAESVARIEALHQSFDPWEHEAVFHQETSDFPEGQVVQVFRQGYRLRDKVIRPAQVVVAKRPSEAGASEG